MLRMDGRSLEESWPQPSEQTQQAIIAAWTADARQRGCADCRRVALLCPVSGVCATAEQNAATTIPFDSSRAPSKQAQSTEGVIRRL